MIHSLPELSALMCASVATTSSAVSGSPFCQVTSVRSLMVQVSSSAEISGSPTASSGTDFSASS